MMVMYIHAGLRMINCVLIGYLYHAEIHVLLIANELFNQIILIQMFPHIAVKLFSSVRLLLMNC